MHVLSRYRYTHEIRNDATTPPQRWLSEAEPVRFEQRADNRYHVARDGDTWWGLAFRYLAEYERAAGLWWIIADFQDPPVVDPTIAIPAGTLVAIPSGRFVQDRVFSNLRWQEH